MYIYPQNHKCNKCGHEFMYSESNGHSAPIIDDHPVCPKCYENFLKQHVGLGYCTVTFTDQSEYDKAIAEKTFIYTSETMETKHVVKTTLKHPRTYIGTVFNDGNCWVHLMSSDSFLGSQPPRPEGRGLFAPLTNSSYY